MEVVNIFPCFVLLERQRVAWRRNLQGTQGIYSKEKMLNLFRGMNLMGGQWEHEKKSQSHFFCFVVSFCNLFIYFVFLLETFFFPFRTLAWLKYF